MSSASPAPSPHTPPVSLRPLAAALAHPGGIAKANPDGTFLVSWTARRTAEGSPERSMTVAASDMTAALTAGLVRRAGAGGLIALTPAGRSWLKRAQAPAEPFRAQHQARRVDYARQPGVATMVDDAESPLAWLRRRTDADGRPILNEAQFAAGERLRADFTFAQLQPRTTVDWTSFGGGGRGGGSQGSDLRDDVLRAKERVTAAVRAVGPELAGILVDVCCHLQGLEAVESVAGWPRRSAKVVLLMALSALARHYGLISTPRPSAPMTHWGTEDYRPRVTAPLATGSEAAVSPTSRR